ncbi:NB-ARC domain-containing protein [Actinokineospora soli]|uniref:NB-ARC domain-containing protein n=1 Tax=Actinokineospora soli TaxID=1048753 RepID=A0ABW2TID8_9PSEU
MRDPTDNSVTARSVEAAVLAQTINSVSFGGGGSTRVELPHRFGSVPVRAAGYQVRELSARLPVSAREGVWGEGVTTLVLTGLGGVGKTQLAAELAERVWLGRAVDVLAWVPAQSREQVVAEYARVAAALTGVEDADPDAGARRLLDWLASTDRPWLVVLDDVRAPGELANLWPASGRVVATTRWRGAALDAEGRRVVDVEEFSAAESAAFLAQRLAERPERLEAADELAAELGHLPLALSQAAEYVMDMGLTCAQYLERWRDRRGPLPEVLPEQDDPGATVATTWSMSMERANELKPSGLARRLLALMSFLDPNGIPGDVLVSEPAREYLRGGKDEKAIDPDTVKDCLARLHRLSLVTRVQENDTVRVHTLVQLVTRDQLSRDEAATTAWAAAGALLAVWPDVGWDTALNRLVRANATTLVALSGNALWEPIHPVLLRVGSSLGEAGKVSAAVAYLSRLHATAATQLGVDHYYTLVIQNNLALWQGRVSDVAEVVEALTQLLDEQHESLGPDHPHPLITRNNLAYWRGRAGGPGEAVAALTALVDDQVRLLGKRSPYTLATRGHLALWQGRASGPDHAVTALTALLDDQMRYLLPGHPHILTTRGNLAYWRGQAGDAAGAVTALVALLADQAQVLHSEHPHLFTTRNQLAHWRGQAGDVAGAVADFSALLEDRVRILGPDHPHTVGTRDNLALWRGRLSEA